jgi:hypothetical protein
LEAALGPSAAPVRLTSAIEVELIGHFGLAAITAAERAEAVQHAVVKLIAIRASEADSQGIGATLTVVGSTADQVAGACHVLPNDSPNVAAAKVGRLLHAPILAKLRSLTFSEFEIFGRRVLKELGAVSAHVTPHGGDQGIDFFGEFNLGQLHDLPRPFLRLAHDVRLLFAGQAKHYPRGTIGPDVVRELVGAVSLARTKTFSTDGIDIFQDLEIRPFSPVVALLFTTGEISSGAYRLAASAGIVAKNGDQLAAFLADRGVGMTIGTGVPSFNEVLFDAWLSAA